MERDTPVEYTHPAGLSAGATRAALCFRHGSKEIPSTMEYLRQAAVVQQGRGKGHANAQLLSALMMHGDGRQGQGVGWLRQRVKVPLARSRQGKLK